MDIEVGGYKLSSLNKINIVLGKNGSGKSTLLKGVESNLGSSEIQGKSRYITPERGGVLEISAGIEQEINTNLQWFGQRRTNQHANFRQQSAVQFKNLELLVLRELEAASDRNTAPGFDSAVEQINSLLDNIELRRENPAFKIYKKGTNDLLNPSNISSGEAELISLGIECLAFAKEIESGKMNILFLDEPDVHLHPDLQSRLMRFLKKLVDTHGFHVILATHSTAMLGELSDYANAAVAFMRSGDKELVFKSISDTYRKILPVFGAHPLSNIFNAAPLLLLEGDDDERIWQQAVKSSQGSIKLYPVSCDSVNNINELEQEAVRIINAVYDSGVGYSLRDQDETTEEIRDMPPIKRMKLSCREAENMLLSDDVLASLSLGWPTVTSRFDAWLAVDENKNHSRYATMQAFKEGVYDRKMFKIKEIVVLIAGAILETQKPWEILVGQSIGKMKQENRHDSTAEGSLANYLGAKTVTSLIA